MVGVPACGDSCQVIFASGECRDFAQRLSLSAPRRFFLADDSFVGEAWLVERESVDHEPRWISLDVIWHSCKRAFGERREVRAQSGRLLVSDLPGIKQSASLAAQWTRRAKGSYPPSGQAVRPRFLRYLLTTCPESRRPRTQKKGRHEVSASPSLCDGNELNPGVLWSPRRERVGAIYRSVLP